MKNAKAVKQTTLARKLTFRISAVLFLVFCLLIFNVSTYTRKSLISRELKNLELLSKENAGIARDFMETMINKQNVIVAAVKNIDTLEEDRRVDYLAGLLNTINNEQEDILSLFYVAEPDSLLPDTPDGLSIFTSAGGIKKENTRFTYVDETVYQSAAAQKKLVIADPFKKTIDGQEYTVITVLLPVLSADNKVIGMVGSNIDTRVLAGAEYDTGDHESFKNEIICAHKTVIMDSSDYENTGHPFADVSESNDADRILDSAQNASTLTFLDRQKDGSRIYSAYYPFYVGNSTIPWLSGTSVSEQELTGPVMIQVLLVTLMCAVGFLILVLYSLFAIRRMLKPMKELEAAVTELSRGNLNITVSGGSNDEIGRLSERFNESVQTIYGYVKDIDRCMEMMAQGNFNVYPEKPFIGDFKNIENSITNFIRKMCSTLNQIGVSSDTVSYGADQMSSSSSVLSQGAAEQAASLEELSNTITLLSGQVGDNNENAQTAGIKVGEAAQQLDISQKHMQDMVDAITEMTRQSSEIGKIIKTIEDIAFQTNILALNAAVEAARAGNAGRGFAVVADEVRSLAGKSAQAAQNTTVLIQNSIKSVDLGARIAKEASDSLGAVSEKAVLVMETVNQIAIASQQQLFQIRQISSNVDDVTAVVQTNSATAEESAASSEELASQAQILKSLLSRFKMNEMLTDSRSNPEKQIPSEKTTGQMRETSYSRDLKY